MSTPVASAVVGPKRQHPVFGVQHTCQLVLEQLLKTGVVMLARLWGVPSKQN